MPFNKLSDLKFNVSYDTHKDEVSKVFYEKALTNAKYYDRVSAFFDSKILSRYSRGIEHLYNNQGKIRFIFSEELSEGDFVQMKEGYDARALKKLEEDFERESLDELDKHNLCNLAFLIEQGLVDIKIAFVKPGILHDKMGLIYDDQDNCIYFRGSNNETVAALEANHESFEVSCTWDAQEKENEKIKEAKTKFEQLRNNRFDEGINVIDIPEIIYKKIAKYNKGKLILQQEIQYDNALIADIHNGRLVVYNKLQNEKNIEKNFYFENFIRFYLKKVDNELFDFGEISYVKIKSILSHFVNLAENINEIFLETPELKQFLSDKEYQIEKIKELGKMIKNQNPFVMDYFQEFSNIVNNELERRLRDKQMRDAFFICQMVKSANYSVPGAGKTSIVYGAYGYLSSKQKDKIDNMVVIGPISSFKSRIDEYKLCFGNKRDLKVLNILKCKNKQERISKLKLDSKSYDLILINYEGLDGVKDVLGEIIDSRTLLVFDEVHKIKRVGGVWASAALSICKGAKYKIALTGTPIPNGYVDLYNQLNILYTDEYNTFFNMTPAALGQKNEFVKDEINEKIYPFFCRTTKKQLSIPTPNPDEKVLSYMTPEEKELFSMLHKKYFRNPLQLYIRLLQASNNPRLVLSKIDETMLSALYEDEDEENEIISDYKDELKDINNEASYDDQEKNLIESIDMTSKFWKGINKVKDLVSEGKTVLVRGIFVDTINRISEELDKIGISNEIIYGAVPAEERGEIIERFKSKKIKVLIANPHTMAESVSLHKDCHDAVYFEYSFNLTHMLQSRDRINRLGLPDGQYTQYYYLFLLDESGEDDSIDLKTYNRLKEKEEVMIKAIEGNQIDFIDSSVLDDLKIIMGKN